MAQPSQRPAPREVEVLARRLVTPNMLRLTLGGAGMAGFPEGQDGGYVKLRLPPAPDSEKPQVRTYTIRAQREGEIDVDFALHGVDSGHAGPATRWAAQAQLGDRIEIGGPGPAKPLPAGMDHYLIFGDMTSLPAISVNLENLPRDAKGRAVIEIREEADRQDLDHPEGVAVEWLVNPDPGNEQAVLARAARSLSWPSGSIYAWAASEFLTMQALRSYLREDRDLGRDRLYISSYWKCGLEEDAHKLVKREDAELAGA
ncbi:NADPH-dependent ferric siderophore reductase [Altererythrobacter atlanticus]|uniref:Vibriobactin utilization protein ViuB n=1 Tax=Croceibacterium atlanticum TaxID=1267766 RepID=A0A0F7KW21_9SPHN|nr:siderophore-interacting protein [Croceibacterium atlanticum]AKH42975.1 Vibriobactin utilization protein ViuB [Croceibacterium atlanticum]MBB5734068.1 NADPH-dependent ferric siderophore reductase [Croceibacterium atlanticum]